MKAYIYLLADGMDVFYIGMTTQLKTRKMIHISESKRKKTEKDKKIFSIIDDGRDLKMEVIEACEFNERMKVEQFYIKKYQKLGYKLVNINTDYVPKVVYKNYDNHGLTAIEYQVLNFMAKDKDTFQISEILFRSPRTIETIRQQLKIKSKTQTLPGLMIWAVNLNLITNNIRQ